MSNARVMVKPDTLDEENRNFAQVALRQPVFLNSVPKSGSHLLRNILRMFVPVEQQYQQQFVQWGNMPEHLDAWDPAKNYLSWGHLFFSDASAIELAHVRKVLLVRDPYDWVLARARFFLSEQLSANVEHLRQGKLSVDDLLSLMIFGIHQKAPPLSFIYNFNAAAWLGSDVHLVRYEELVGQLEALETDSAERFFAELLGACGIHPPSDWRKRVRVGSDRQQSGTARENLTGSSIAIPEKLPEAHRRLVDFVSPGLRQLLGYA